MKRILLLFVAVTLICNNLDAQIQSSSVNSLPIFATVNLEQAAANNVWQTNLKTSVKKPGAFKSTEEAKLRNKISKLAQTVQGNTANKTLGATPTIGQSFRANDLTSLTPPDNDVAINKKGQIVAVNNFSIAVYDTSGATLISPTTWNGILSPFSPALVRGKFDPRVVYDPYNDRFIFCILHAPVDTLRNSIVLGFSQTNDPTQGWNIYNLDGNPLKNDAWSDYPSIGINAHELFINCNLFGRSPFPFRGTYIQQIDLKSAYASASTPLQFKTWSGFNDTVFITLTPAPNGLMESPNATHMNFVMTNPGEDTLVHMFTITDTMNATGVSIVNSQFTVPIYSACADAYIKEPGSPKDSLSTGACWVHSAYTLDSIVHFTFASNAGGSCGINYGRINLGAQTAEYTTYSEPGTDLAFPAIAPLGYNGTDKNAAIVYLRADTTIYPELCVISIDDNQTFSNAQTVKTGDTMLSILNNQTERWGDYTGIARNYANTVAPEVWIYGCYSAHTTARWTYNERNGYANWIAQVKSNDFAVSVANTIKKQDVKLYPNPAVSMYFLEFELNKTSDVKIDLYDINGRKVKNLFDGNLPASKNEFTFNRNALSSGQYFVKINVDGATQTKKLVVVE